MYSRLSFALASLVVVGAFACSQTSERPGFDTSNGDGGEAPFETPPGPGFIREDQEAGLGDAGGDGSFDTCAATAVEAPREKLPVDIIWIVDNSASMQPAVAEVQAGINAFANLIGTKGIDYKVVMLAKRGSTPSGSTYPICVPPPLGGADCGNGPNFFHASVDIKSTQTLEQFLGTLGQTQGYTQGDERGSEPWAQELRSNATKSIVVVTDDNSRFTVTDFETFPGGKNPSNSTMLPPGVLDPSRGDQFKGYVFSGIYGWGSETVASTKCKFPNDSEPDSAGQVYTELVKKTGGVRAKICDGSAAWGPFFDAVAQAVERSARVACELAIPPPDGGILDPEQVNVRVTDGTNPAVVVPRVANEAACGNTAGWYYDNATAP
ncbi:MAG: hypothetical protein K0S65_2194, partial [Labilithrix sp.]|nr:hypothetical protein [Labilithrix sp.]